MSLSKVLSKKYLTDRQLRERWQCSAMKLWRLRRRKLLRKPTRIGGTGPNLTEVSDVETLEAAGDQTGAAG